MAQLSRKVFEDRDQFIWPEPCVIDIMQEQYFGLLEPADLLPVARLHARLLKSLFENEIGKAEVYRKQLVAECAGHDITSEEIAQIDRRAFWEITGLIHSSLRPASRSASPIGASLHAAVCRLGVVSLHG